MAYEDIKIWSDWTIKREIGSGSFGKVYEIHRRNGKYLEKAALKVIRIPASNAELLQLRAEGIRVENTEQYLERHVEDIRNEIGLMQQFVGYTNIVSYEDYLIRKHTKDIGWDIYIRMELLGAVSDLMSQRKLSDEEIIQMGIDISNALVICHGAGIIHRDIKPQNIFRNNRGFFKLGDFGISRTMPGVGDSFSFKGTISYMAPEAYARRSNDARSDIYSLALVLYRCLNGGREPFLTTNKFGPAEKEAAQMRRLRGDALPNPERGSKALCNVLLTALAPDPAARYQTAAQFHDALVAVAGNNPDVHRKELKGGGRNILPNKKSKDPTGGSRDNSVKHSGTGAQQFSPKKKNKAEKGTVAKASSGRNKILIGAAAAACVLLIAAGSSLFFSHDSNDTNDKYSKNISAAAGETDLTQKTAYYTAAMELQPDNPEAYNNLVTDLEREPELTEEVYSNVESCINSKDRNSSGQKTVIEVLKDSNPQTYADFNFKYGSLVYLGCPSEKSNAADKYLSNAVNSGALDSSKLEVATMMYELADAYRQRAESVSVNGSSDLNVYSEYWDKLELVAKNLETLQKETGNEGYPVRVCDEVANEFINNGTNYLISGVSVERLRDTLSDAAEYMSQISESIGSQSSELQDAAAQVNSNLETAVKGVGQMEGNTESILTDSEQTDETQQEETEQIQTIPFTF